MSRTEFTPGDIGAIVTVEIAKHGKTGTLAPNGPRATVVGRLEQYERRQIESIVVDPYLGVVFLMHGDDEPRRFPASAIVSIERFGS